MHATRRSDSFDYIYIDETEESASNPMSSRAQLPALEPFTPARHTLRVELAEHNPVFPSLDLTGPMPIHETYVYVPTASAWSYRRD